MKYLLFLFLCYVTMVFPIRMNKGDTDNQNDETPISNIQSFIQIKMEPSIENNKENDQEFYTGTFEDNLQALRESSFRLGNDDIETFDDFYFVQEE